MIPALIAAGATLYQSEQNRQAGTRQENIKKTYDIK